MLNKIKGNHKILILIDQGIFSGGSFLLTIMLARNLNASDFGHYSGVMLFIFLFTNVLSAFITQPFQVNYSKEADLNSYINFSIVTQVTLTLVIGLVLYALEKLGNSVFIFGLNCILFFIFFSLNDFFRKILLSLEKSIEVVWFDFIGNFSQIIGVFYLLYFSDCYINLSSLYFFLYISYLPALIYALYTLQPQLSFKKTKKHLKTHYSQGKWLVMTTLVQWWSSNLFVVASGIYIGKQALGAFRLAQTLFGILNMLLQTFENYVLPKTSFYFQQNKLEGTSFLSKMTRISSFVFIPIIVLLFLFSNFFMEIIGGTHFVEYSYLIKWMAFLYLIVFICQPVRILIRVLLLNNYFFYGYLISLGFSVLSSNYLLRSFQLNGAIIGLIGSQVLLLIFWSSILSKNNFKTWKLFI